MRRLWGRLAGIYGADRWERAYGAEPAEAWAGGLAHCTLDALARGVEKAERDDSGRLPTLGIFRLWCKEFQPGTFAGAAAPEPKPAPLPRIEHMAGRTEKGRQWLAFMVLEGIIPRPERMTRDDVETALDDCDIAAMRAAVAREVKHIRTLAGVTP